MDLKVPIKTYLTKRQESKSEKILHTLNQNHSKRIRRQKIEIKCLPSKTSDMAFLSDDSIHVVNKSDTFDKLLKGDCYKKVQFKNACVDNKSDTSTSISYISTPNLFKKVTNISISNIHHSPILTRSRTKIKQKKLQLTEIKDFNIKGRERTLDKSVDVSLYIEKENIPARNLKNDFKNMDKTSDNSCTDMSIFIDKKENYVQNSSIKQQFNDLKTQLCSISFLQSTPQTNLSRKIINETLSPITQNSCYEMLKNSQISVKTAESLYCIDSCLTKSFNLVPKKLVNINENKTTISTNQSEIVDVNNIPEDFQNALNSTSNFYGFTPSCINETANKLKIIDTEIDLLQHTFDNCFISKSPLEINNSKTENETQSSYNINSEISERIIDTENSSVVEKQFLTIDDDNLSRKSLINQAIISYQNEVIEDRSTTKNLDSIGYIMSIESCSSGSQFDNICVSSNSLKVNHNSKDYSSSSRSNITENEIQTIFNSSLETSGSKSNVKVNLYDKQQFITHRRQLRKHNYTQTTIDDRSVNENLDSTNESQSNSKTEHCKLDNAHAKFNDAYVRLTLLKLDNYNYNASVEDSQNSDINLEASKRKSNIKENSLDENECLTKTHSNQNKSLESSSLIETLDSTNESQSNLKTEHCKLDNAYAKFNDAYVRLTLLKLDNYNYDASVEDSQNSDINLEARKRKSNIKENSLDKNECLTKKHSNQNKLFESSSLIETLDSTNESQSNLKTEDCKLDNAYAKFNDAYVRLTRLKLDNYNYDASVKDSQHSDINLEASKRKSNIKGNSLDKNECVTKKHSNQNKLFESSSVIENLDSSSDSLNSSKITNCIMHCKFHNAYVKLTPLKLDNYNCNDYDFMSKNESVQIMCKSNLEINKVEENPVTENQSSTSRHKNQNELGEDNSVIEIEDSNDILKNVNTEDFNFYNAYVKVTPLKDNIYCKNKKRSSDSNTSDISEDDDVFLEENKKPVVTLMPGKFWRRSLLQQKRNSIILSTSILNDSSDVNFIQQYNQSVRRSSFRIVPECHKELNNQQSEYSLLEKYATKIYNKTIIEEECDNNFLPLNDFTNNSLSAKNIVLNRCGQTEPLPFEKCYSNSELENCRKIGEGVYGEVFLLNNSDGSNTVLKVIPVEGDVIVNGEHQKKFEEILSEIVITMELSNLRNGSKNRTSNFIQLQKVRCVKGKYPSRLLELWNLYNNTENSENDSPKIFNEEQLFIILELANGGKDLESFTFTGASYTYSVYKQIVCALAVAENALQFEHRDLHWGNILISKCNRNKKLLYILNGETIEIPTQGLEVSIIDYTLSRITFNEVIIYNDLSLDQDLFTSTGEDYQFEIYRLMQKKNKNEWKHFQPYTNVLWCHYILKKIINDVQYKSTKTKIHKQYKSKLEALMMKTLDYLNVKEMLKDL